MGKFFNIGIDAHCLGEGKGGNETYTRCLINHLAKLSSQYSYHAYCSKYYDVHAADYMSWRQIKWNNPYYRICLGFPYSIYQDNLDLFHMQYFAPFYCSVPLVLTIHDLAWKVAPHLFSLKEQCYFKYVDVSIRKATKIIAVSENTKKDILYYYPFVEEDKIHVVYNGVDHLKKVSDQRVDRGDNYLLFVSNLHPKKNLELCIKAFVLLKKEMPTLKFVIVGRWASSSYRVAILNLIRQKGLENEIIFKNVETWDSDELVTLYENARVFLYPSFYEGFGLPPLEAMQCGTPSVVSNRGALPEVLADSSLFCDVDDENQFAKKIKELLSNDHLKNSLLEKGSLLIEKYTWKKAAREIKSIYNEVLGD